MFSNTEVTIVELPLSSIRTDGGTQPRAELDYEMIQNYAQDMLLGDRFPAIKVFYDGTDYWLADGFHRYYAAQQICKEAIATEIIQGTLLDAVWESLGANKAHGLRRSNADKQRSIQTALHKFPHKSDREIAKHCGVDHKTVGAMREKLSGEFPQIERVVERNGTTYTMNVTNIGPHSFESQEQQYIPLTLDEVQKLEPLAGPSYDPIYQSPSPVYTQPTSEQLDARTQPLERWQQDNRALGLDRWGDVLSDENDDDILVEDVVPQSVVEPEEKPEERSHFMQIMTSSETPEWYTPEHIVARVIELFGEIDLDPCSNSHEQPSIPAHTHYTKDDDGLSQEWNGKIYMNPPYGTEIAKWTAKLVESHKRGTVEEAIALLPGRIDTSWFQPLYNYLICNIRGRLQFSGAEYSAPFPSVAVYMGDRKEDFKKAFKTLGPIVERVA